MRVAVVGLGYVGLTTAVGLANLGRKVVGVERFAPRLELLRRQRAPFYEPGMDDALRAAVDTGRLEFAGELTDIDGQADAVVIAVGSPPLPSGGADLTQVEDALDAVLAGELNPDVIVVKSSIPPGTSDGWLASGRYPGLRDRYAYVPEALNQGAALRDWMEPDRIVLGGWNDRAIGTARQLFDGIDTTFLVTAPAEAEAIKYASNAYLATRISFANELAGLCEVVGADIDRVLHGAGLDPRVGGLFWRPGIGYGDSCLSKDVAALIQMAAGHGHAMPILESVQATNRVQHLRPLAILRQERPRWAPPPSVAVLGLAYEPHSDDIRAAPSLTLLPQLRLLARDITVWDPLLPAHTVADLFPFARRADTPADAVRAADAVLLLTEYPDVVDGHWAAHLRRDGDPVIVVDGKNCLRADALDGRTTVYRAIGKPPAPRPDPLLPNA